MAPGDTFQFRGQELTFSYLVEGDTIGESYIEQPQMKIEIGDHIELLDMVDHMQTSINSINIRIAQGPPGMLVRTVNQAKVLAVPGQSSASSQVGLVFPGEGNEKSVLLPSTASALRIVRGSERNENDSSKLNQADNEVHFLVEVFNSQNAEPSVRHEFTSGEQLTLDVNESGLTLQLEPLPALMVRARYFPGAWLILPAIFLMVIGGIGFWQRPAFLITQISPWPHERSVIVYQSDSKSVIEPLLKTMYESTTNRANESKNE